MPLKFFECPDHVRIETAECLKEGNCRMGVRCASRSYLMMAASDRPTLWRCPNCGTEVKEEKKC